MIVNKKRRLRKLVRESLERRVLLASDWQNPGQQLDVNHDLSVSPLDGLIGINRLNSEAQRAFPDGTAGSTEPFYDVDGNGAHNPLDILLVINALNARKPMVTVELSKDSGVGPAASTDRITSDISVRGAIKFDTASQLWRRLDSDTLWYDFTQFVTSNQTFSIPQSELVKAFGRVPNDGTHLLRFQARFGINHDQLGGEVDLPLLLDTSSQELNIAGQSKTPTTIIASSPNLIEVSLGERASPTTLLASKIKLYDATFDKLPSGSVESRDTTESVDVGTAKSFSVIPYGTAIFPIALKVPTELFLDTTTSADGNSTQLYRKSAATGPTGQTIEHVPGIGQFFGGQGVVWATNASAEPYNISFTVQDVNSLPQPLHSWRQGVYLNQIAALVSVNPCTRSLRKNER